MNVSMELTPELWRRVKGIASGALDRADADQAAYVVDACGGDEALRREVESLLRSTVAAGTAAYLELPAVAVAPMPMGTRIGAYRLVRELGSGGMGAVYLAERDDREFQQRVAIKVVRGGLASAFLLHRFREERRILASLEHPNIARLLDGGASDGGLPYVVMEYVDGESIDVYCRTRRLPLAARLDVFCRVCAAVQYAHQRLVIHRDIKCGNVLVTQDGVPKLLDFGIAKLLNPDLDPEQQAITMERVMTPESASPEQLRGEPITVAADVYALGVVLYRLLAGRTPYGDLPASEAALIEAVCERVPELPSAVARRQHDTGVGPIPADVDLIVMKALRKEPDRRYGSAAQLADDVRRYLEGRPILAAPDTLGYRARKFVTRNRWAVAGAAAVVVTLCAGVAATSWQARVASQQRARAEREFNAVRTLANAVLGELHDAVTKLPGSVAAREVLLRRATDYLDTLSADAAADVDLRRELARGYRRLAQVQGFQGLANLGDTDAARRSLERAASLLQPIAEGGGATARDRIELADIWVQLGKFDRRGHSPTEQYDRARALLDALPAANRSTADALRVEQGLWYGIANDHARAKNYAAARDAYVNEVRAADAVFHLSPDDMDASRNLSIGYKQLGAVLELLGRPDEAIDRYQRAMALDRARTEREPARATWRLDLSFAIGSMGGALMAKDDLAGALEQYRQAVDLRRAVVAEDPNDDFAQTSLARGYARLAVIAGRMKDAPAAIDWDAKRLEVLRGRAAAHLDRDRAWADYAAAAAEAIGRSVDLLEKGRMTRGARRAAASRVRAMVEQFQALDARRPPSHAAGGAAPEREQIRRLQARLARLPPG